MFGLTIEKLVLVAICAAVIIGPHRLPEYAHRLSSTVRRLTLMAAEARRRAEEDTGVAFAREDWRALDPRRYDPRRIVREAWDDADAATVPTSPAEVAVDAAQLPEPAAESVVTAPAGRWVVSGSSAHPRRIWVSDEDAVVAASS